MATDDASSSYVFGIFFWQLNSTRLAFCYLLKIHFNPVKIIIYTHQRAACKRTLMLSRKNPFVNECAVEERERENEKE